jgi:ABC-type transport system substrate-binding protein
MRRIWPDVEGGPELAAEMARRFPRVVVGVEHPATGLDSRSIANPAARRAGRLVERGLLEFAGAGPEGGQYVCPLGTVDQSVDGLELVFNIRAGGGHTGYDVSRLLLAWARPDDPNFQPAWARTLKTVRVSGVNRVTADLKAPHVLAQALLQGSYDPVANVGQPGVRGSGPFYVFSRDAELTRFSANDRPGVPRVPLAEVSERYYSDPQRALLGLARGEIDILERVFPGDLPALRSDQEIAVAALTMPTTHVLVIRERHPYLANRTFRRALVYGLNRELILNQGLLRGQSLPGFQVVSAPFPAPTGSGDSQAYAYDQQIQPRPFDPRLALTLRLVAERELKTAFEKLQQQPPALTPLVLGHPADESSRIACRAIVKQWEQIGVKCTLTEFPPGQFDEPGNCDLIYLQTAAWEPVVDAGRLLGPEGIAPAKSAFIQLTLRQIERATNWQQARDRFRQLHRLLHEDVSVIPLYQTFDYYAYRKSLQGLETPRATLYANIDRWQVAPPLAAAAATPSGPSVGRTAP